ncbi:hypothetical protein GCM10022419_123330 [Nonomuraea rosea]|uniref:Uncharacterized protein n=1 Tax=Nonomuraea rosea TaxID=638574 RepID=A0ABP6ZT27_9ACTN
MRFGLRPPGGSAPLAPRKPPLASLTVAHPLPGYTVGLLEPTPKSAGLRGGGARAVGFGLCLPGGSAPLAPRKPPLASLTVAHPLPGYTVGLLEPTPKSAGLRGGGASGCLSQGLRPLAPETQFGGLVRGFPASVSRA